MAALLIIVAGPYSAPTAEGRAANLAAMNRAAAAVARLGHIPVIGVNAALSLALAARCDGCLHIARSSGADREAEALRTLGRPVWTRLEEIPRP